VLSPLTPGKIRRQQNDGAQVIDVRPGGIGAGILNHGTMMIAGSRITGNTAPNDSHGSPGIGGGIGNVPSQGGCRARAC
jgi:hypothetical protein